MEEDINIVIEKNIPYKRSVFDNLSVVEKAKKYKIDKMEIGDSIFIDNQDTQDTIPKLAHSYGYKVGKRFSCLSKRLGISKKGVRIWRIK